MDGVFLENGPFRFKGENLVLNEYGWHQNAHVVYLDQPNGVGYSMGPPTTSFEQLIKLFIGFLIKFYELFPELRMAELYIGGESFAASWIPYAAREIISRNEIKHEFNLKGIMLGNGWFDPVNQYPAMLEFSKHLNIVSEEYLQKSANQLKVCQEILKEQPGLNNYEECEEIIKIILVGSQEKY